MLAAAIILIHVIFFHRFFTALISDEVTYLLSAKYLFDKIDLGYFGYAMKGYSLFLYLLAIPLGGLRRFSSWGVYQLAWTANLGIVVVFIASTYAYLREFKIDFRHALIGTLTAASLPFFYIFTPLAMTEVWFASLLLLYLFVLLRYFDRPCPSGAPYLLATLALTAALTATKATGTYDVGMACILAIFLYRINSRTIVFVVTTLITVYLVRQTRMIFAYNLSADFLSGILSPARLLLFSLGVLTSICLASLYVVPLMRLPVPARDRKVNVPSKRWPATLFTADWWRQSPDQTGNPAVRARNGFLIAIFAFMLPSILISSMFHALINNLTNFRTVSSVVPVFLVTSIALVCVPGDAGDAQTPRGFALKSAVIRMAAVLAVFGIVMTIQATLPPRVGVDYSDFITTRAFYDYFTAPSAGNVKRNVLIMMAAFTFVSLFYSASVRMLGLVAINIALLAHYPRAPWAPDQNAVNGHAANLRMYRAVKEAAPKSVALAEFHPDIQWGHFSYPYKWYDIRTTDWIVFHPGAETIAGQGFGVIRREVLNAEAVHKEIADVHAFFAYDLDNPRIRDVEKLEIRDLIARGNTVNAGPVEKSGETSFAYARDGFMVGPLVLPSNQSFRVTFRAPAIDAEWRYRDCALAANASRWPLEIVAAPGERSKEWVLAANVKSDQPRFGMLRLECLRTVRDANGMLVSLPLSEFSIVQSK